MNKYMKRGQQFATQEISPIFMQMVKSTSKLLQKEIKSFAENELKNNLIKNIDISFGTVLIQGKTGIADHEFTFKCSCGPLNMSCVATHVQSAQNVTLQRQTKWVGYTNSVETFVSDAITQLVEILIEQETIFTPSFINWITEKLVDKGWTVNDIVKQLHDNGLTLVELSELLTKQGWTLKSIANYLTSSDKSSKL